jgi:hypothetical protein
MKVQARSYDKPKLLVPVSLGIVLGFIVPAHGAPKQLPDQCGAKQYERFIGKPVTALQDMSLPEVRFVCSNCAMTMDVRTSRLTVIYSDKTKLITKLSCG